MSTEELPPPLDETARAFLDRHADTGTPDAAQLARSRERLASAVRAEEGPPPAARRRPVVPLEVLAVAAVILVGIVAQLVWLAIRPPVGNSAPDAGPLAAIEDSYRTGDLQAARLAAAACNEPDCKPLTAKLQRVLDLNARFSTLSDAELDELATLDVELSGGAGTGISKAIADRRTAADTAVAVNPEALADEARALMRSGKSEEAMAVVDRCIKATDAARCHLVRASLLAREAVLVSAGNEPLLEKARAEYERFLVLAPPSDPDVPKVRAILAAAEPSGGDSRASGRIEPRDVFEHAERLQATDPSEAQRLYSEVLTLTRPGNEWFEKASAALEKMSSARIDARDLYLRGYQLRDADPDAAAELFAQVVEATPADDETHQKALIRLRELAGGSKVAKDLLANPVVPTQVRLRVGQRRTLTIAGLSRISVADPSTVDVRASGTKLELRGAARGVTTLVVWRGDGNRVSIAVTVE